MRLSPIFVCTVLASMATLGCAPSSSGQKARVISIGDGDTIRVQQGHQQTTIRLGCIDAPEMAQAPHGANARSYLQSRLQPGSIVMLKPHSVDRYGRTVAEVIGDVNINLALVEGGQAFAYRKYLGQCDVKAYLNAEEWASRRRYGVWQIPGGITRPWDFRRSPRRTSSIRSRNGRPYRPSGQNSAMGQLTCRAIGSFTQAQEYLHQGHSYLDPDRDGIACESLRQP